jgi:hypothetical protein
LHSNFVLNIKDIPSVLTSCFTTSKSVDFTFILSTEDTPAVPSAKIVESTTRAQQTLFGDVLLFLFFVVDPILTHLNLACGAKFLSDFKATTNSANGAA